MGSMWIDPNEDPKTYPIIPTANFPVPDFEAGNMTGARRFPEKSWGADFISLLALLDFAESDVPGQSWRQEILKGLVDPPTRGPRLEQGLQELIEYQKEDRTALMNEILAQAGDFQMYFCASLGIYPRSHPNTYQLMKNAARIGELTMVFLKRLWATKSVRPSHVYPRLVPPIPVPPHPSFPSGHAMISALLARTVISVAPKLRDAPMELANRIARNREVAGLHFRWDSVGGQTAAENVFRIFETMDAYTDYKDRALEEWR